MRKTTKRPVITDNPLGLDTMGRPGASTAPKSVPKVYDRYRLNAHRVSMMKRLMDGVIFMPLPTLDQHAQDLYMKTGDMSGCLDHVQAMLGKLGQSWSAAQEWAIYTGMAEA